MSSLPSGAPRALPRGDRRPWQPATSAWLITLLGWTTFLCFQGLEGGARFEPIDCWVAQTAREMYESDPPNRFLVPVFSSETRMQKSPGPYWAVMLVAWLRGAADIDEATARVPSALAGILLVLTVFWLARRIGGDRAAVFAGFAASSSVLILWWSHRAASDLGLAAFTTLSLAALWIAMENEPAGPKRIALLMLGYFAAGLGMIYKMPMPLVVVGLPVAVYILALRRWSVLLNGWHFIGVLAFLLPWLPWVVGVLYFEDAALYKWKVEFLDRFTGNLPNVEGQGQWKFLLTYLGPTVVFTLPFALSLPGAFVRAFRQPPGIEQRGAFFMVIWFASHLVFFTAATGKEWRYFLPAIPPLFVLLGLELAAFFDPQRPHRPARDWLGAFAVWLLVPAALFGGGLYVLRKWYDLRGQYELAGESAWGDVWAAYLVAAMILCVGFGLSAWLYRGRQEHASFGAIVGTMWLMWLWAWPNFMPLVMSQRPFLDFAEQLRRKVPSAYYPDLRMVGSQDSRIIWYSDVRYPRIIDQLDLLKEQDGRRSLEYEIRRVGAQIVEELAADKRTLLVAALPDLLMFLQKAPPEVEAAGREMPPMYLWLQTRYGTLDRHFVLFGNRPPPFPAPELRLPDELRAKQAAKGVRFDLLR